MAERSVRFREDGLASLYVPAVNAKSFSVRIPGIDFSEVDNVYSFHVTFSLFFKVPPPFCSFFCARIG